MLQPHIKLGRVRGFELGIHYSWLPLAFLLLVSVAGSMRMASPQWSGGLVWGVAGATVALFFGTLLMHEAAHALVAHARGLRVRSITLFALGGVTQISREAAEPRTELWMGLIGPVVSLLIGVTCLWISALAGGTGGGPERPLAAAFGWLGSINVALSLFNLVPAFPLDGGRVLRAVAWRWSGDVNWATRLAARTGQAVAVLLIVWGLFRFFTGAGFSGLWLCFIGWFLLEASTASFVHSEAGDGLGGTRVADLMAREVPVVDGHESVQEFVRDYLLRTGRHCWVVQEEGHVAGLITPHEVKGVPPQRWGETPVDRAMRPLPSVRTVGPETPAAEALELMSREDLNQLPVLAEGRLEGLISRGQILRYLNSRSVLQV